ncbi:MAG TPA: SecY family transport protein, partial [Candidatus Tumulicola sp.]|nr:SecY family transport protein [Candidatus Tumulicola sp.]
KGNIQPLKLAFVVAIVLATVATIVFFERAQRRIPIYYARRTVGRRIYGGQTAHLPLRVNTSGTIPPIFASSLLMFPATLANFKIPGMSALQGMLNRGDWAFNTFYVLLIIFFCHFYTAVTFQPVDVADNLKKQQAFIPSIRLGKQTADYIDYVLTRITFGGSLYVAVVCIVPSIILQLLTMVFKPLDELRKEGEQGQRKIDQYTRYGTIILSLIQGFGIAMSLEGMNNGDLSDSAAVGDVVTHAGWGFRLMTMLTLTTGTAFMMWVGEQITERGIGNGISLLIFAGIVDGVPDGIAGYFATNKGNIQPLNLAAVVAITLATVATIVFFERAQRRIPIYYARRTVGRRIYGGQTAHLPLRAN